MVCMQQLPVFQTLPKGQCYKTFHSITLRPFHHPVLKSYIALIVTVK
jgi:hypothetical protein